MGLAISIMKIKDALGYFQHIRLSQPDSKGWLNEEKESFSPMETEQEAKSLLEPSHLETEQEPLRGFAGLSSLV